MESGVHGAAGGGGARDPLSNFPRDLFVRSSCLSDTTARIPFARAVTETSCRVMMSKMCSGLFVTALYFASVRAAEFVVRADHPLPRSCLSAPRPRSDDQNHTPRLAPSPSCAPVRAPPRHVVLGGCLTRAEHACEFPTCLSPPNQPTCRGRVSSVVHAHLTHPDTHVHTGPRGASLSPPPPTVACVRSRRRCATARANSRAGSRSWFLSIRGFTSRARALSHSSGARARRLVECLHTARAVRGNFCACD